MADSIRSKIKICLSFNKKRLAFLDKLSKKKKSGSQKRTTLQSLFSIYLGMLHTPSSVQINIHKLSSSLFYFQSKRMAELTRPYCTFLILLTSICWCQRSDPVGGRPSCNHCDWQLFCNCSSSGYSRIPKVTDLALSLDLAFNSIAQVTDDDLMGHKELRALSLNSKIKLGQNFTKFSFTTWQICEDQWKLPPQATGWPWYNLLHLAPCRVLRSWTFPTTSWPPSIIAGSRSLKLCSASICSTTRTGSYSVCTCHAESGKGI